MPSALKDLLLGLIIGICVAAMAGIAIIFSVGHLNAPAILPSTLTPTLDRTPTTLPPATATFTFTPSPIPTVTYTPSATLTPDAIQALVDSGGLIFTGPLSNAHQVSLYRSSLNYAASDPDESRRMAKQINGVGYGDPTNICGPLAEAILRDAGLITPAITPHDFWLLNPLASSDKKLLLESFPPNDYEYFRTLTPINKMDWHSLPLLPGDFLFIWHGSGGNFDHMLVVSRVDRDLRAYAVTNFGTPAGYVIAETLLYDPDDPTVGIFHTWTQERNAILGSTGFGGFELWRRRAP